MKKTIPIIVFTVLGTILLVGFAPISSLSVTGLKETYLQGEPVTFVISQNGCGISCDFFDFTIVDKDDKPVWGTAMIIDMSPPFPNMLYSYSHAVGQDYPEPIIIDTPGTYTLKIKTNHQSIEKKIQIIAGEK